jgi:hypothetical protein
MMRRTHRLAAFLAAATAAFGAAATSAADTKPGGPQPQPGAAPSCSALAEPAADLSGLKEKVFHLAGSAGNATKNGMDFGSLIALYGQSQDILRSLRDESGALRTAGDEVHEPELRDSALALADTFDEGAALADQFASPTTPKPQSEDLAHKVTDLSKHAAVSLQRFGDSYQKTCGVDLGLGGLTAMAKSLNGVNQSPAPAAPAQQPPAPAAPTAEADSAPALTSNKSLLAPAPIK